MADGGVGLEPRRRILVQEEDGDTVMSNGTIGGDALEQELDSIIFSALQETTTRWIVGANIAESTPGESGPRLNSPYPTPVHSMTPSEHHKSEQPATNQPDYSSYEHFSMGSPSLNLNSGRPIIPPTDSEVLWTISGPELEVQPVGATEPTFQGQNASTRSAVGTGSYADTEMLRAAPDSDGFLPTDPVIERDSDGDISGGVAIQQTMDGGENKLASPRSLTTEIETHSSSSLQAVPPLMGSIQTTTGVGVRGENSDTDMERHVDDSDDSSHLIAMALAVGYEVNQVSSGGLSPLDELLQWIPPPQAEVLAGSQVYEYSSDTDSSTAAAQDSNAPTPLPGDLEQPLGGYSFTLSQGANPGNDGQEVVGVQLFDPNLNVALEAWASSSMEVEAHGIELELPETPAQIHHQHHHAHDSYDDFETNMKVAEFFESWRESYAQGARFPQIGEQALVLGIDRMKVPDEISIEDLDGDYYDIQGINWPELGARREDARAIRNRSYHNYRNLTSDGVDHPHMQHSGLSDNSGRPLPSCDNYFRFQKFMTPPKAKLGQFQLRHLMAAPSRNSVFYATTHGVECIDTTLNTQQRVIDISKISDRHYSGIPTRMSRISTLTASDGVLAVGGYNGEYALKSLYSPNDGNFVLGKLSHEVNSITNHVHTFPERRSGLPQAVFCSNDEMIRVLDCHTDKIVREHKIAWAINCSATSPDARLRLIVGDDTQPLVLEAESGREVAKLQRHHDYGFACDWSPDGVYMATGNQDGTVQLWDARNWDKPLSDKTIGTELGGIRSLHFSPLGAGRPVLLMAEPADIVSVVDAVTFDTRQRFDFFGEIGGTSFVHDGSAFFVANMDSTFGGLIEFDRVSWDKFTAPRALQVPNPRGLAEMEFKNQYYSDETYSEYSDEERGEDFLPTDYHDWVHNENRAVRFGL